MELDRLEQDWTAEVERYKIQNKDGSREIAHAGVGILQIVPSLAFGIFWVSCSFRYPIFCLVGVMVVGFLLAGGYKTMRKAKQFEHALARYERRRAELFKRGARAR